MTTPVNDELCASRHSDQHTMQKAKASLPQEDLVMVASELLKALSDPTRMRLLSALRAVGELCVCDLAASLEMTESAISHQLRLLRTHRLVQYKKLGRQVFYSLADDHVSQILDCALEHARENI